MMTRAQDMKANTEVSEAGPAEKVRTKRTVKPSPVVQHSGTIGRGEGFGGHKNTVGQGECEPEACGAGLMGKY